MVKRSQLVALDFNSGSHIRQAEAQNGVNQYNVNYSKIKNLRTSKPIK